VRRTLLALTLALAGLLPALPARALVNQELVPVQVQYAKAWRVQQGDLGGAATRISALQAQAEPADLLGVLRHDLQLAVAQYDYRAAIRSQQQVVYALAVDQGLEDQVSGLLPTSDLPPLRQTTEALRALWRAAGIGDFSQVAIRHNRRFQDSAPVGQLLGFEAMSLYNHVSNKHDVLDGILDLALARTGLRRDEPDLFAAAPN